MGQMINRLKYAIGCTALVSCVACSCFAQSQPGISDKFENYSRNSLQEKLFVHTDRAAYFTGELLWFKVYAVDGIYNKPFNMSKVAYVEILDDKQVPVMQAKIALVDGEMFSWYGSRLLHAAAYFEELLSEIKSVKS